MKSDEPRSLKHGAAGMTSFRQTRKRGGHFGCNVNTLCLGVIIVMDELKIDSKSIFCVEFVERVRERYKFV